MMYEAWVPTGAWSGRHWYGNEQVEDRSRANVARCYNFLLSRPYLSAEDRERLELLKFVQVMKAKA